MSTTVSNNNEDQAVSIQAQSLALSGAPTQTIAYSIVPVENCGSGGAISVIPQSIRTISVAAPTQVCSNPTVDSRWADYSPENVELPFPELPEPDYKCYQAPQVPPGQTRYLKIDEPAKIKNVEQNFNDVKTAIRENNTHVQRNRTQITQVNRNHNHLLRIVTNENNFEHNLTNKIVRVQDTHRQKIENVKGETRNFKDFKQTQKVQTLGCRRSNECAATPVCVARPTCVATTPALSTIVSRPSTAFSVAAQRPLSKLAPSVATSVRYIEPVTSITQPTATLRSVRSIYLQ